MWGFMLGLIVGYVCGWHDTRWGQPPPPHRGTYEHCEDPDDDERGNYDID